MGPVNIEWSPNFAYAIGLIATDGCLSLGRHTINLTSKDEDQILNFKRCLRLGNAVGKKGSGTSLGKRYFVLQFADANFYEYLNSIGIFSHKSKTIGALTIDKRFFFDFLRGHFDGDGTFYSYFDKRWKDSFMFYSCFNSASREHVEWLRKEIRGLAGIFGHISKSNSDPVYKLRFAKAESLILLPRLYYNGEVICLARKRFKVEAAIGKL